MWIHSETLMWHYKNIQSNYGLVSLLLICEKTFAGYIIFNSLFEYLEEQNLPSTYESDFQARDFCVNQLLSILHDM